MGAHKRRSDGAGAATVALPRHRAEHGGEDPLDSSGVHPEAYPVVRRILAASKSDIKALIGNAEIVRQLKPSAVTAKT